MSCYLIFVGTQFLWVFKNCVGTKNMWITKICGDANLWVLKNLMGTQAFCGLAKFIGNQKCGYSKFWVFVM